jgi:hypothetical protein
MGFRTAMYRSRAMLTVMKIEAVMAMDWAGYYWRRSEEEQI